MALPTGKYTAKRATEFQPPSDESIPFRLSACINHAGQRLGHEEKGEMHTLVPLLRDMGRVAELVVMSAANWPGVWNCCMS